MYFLFFMDLFIFLYVIGFIILMDKHITIETLPKAVVSLVIFLLFIISFAFTDMWFSVVILLLLLMHITYLPLYFLFYNILCGSLTIYFVLGVYYA